MAWTDDRIDKLKQLWGKGNTASQIAQIIGDVTRNAVIGKANRLNLSNKISRKSSIHASSGFHKEKSTSLPKKGRRTKFKSLIIEKYILVLQVLLTVVVVHRFLFLVDIM